MIDDYRSGTNRTNEQAVAAAIEFRDKILENDDDVYARHLGNTLYIDSIGTLYNALLDGPIYAVYNGITVGHAVVVTGVNLNTGIIYTYNPWDFEGQQTFNQFLNGYVGQDEKRTLMCCVIPY